MIKLRIKDLRRAAGLRQIELARALGFSNSLVCQWEAGTAVPTTETLPKLAQVLGCTIDALFETEAKP